MLWINKLYGPIGFTLVKYKPKSMLFKAIKPYIDIKKCSPDNTTSFSVILIDRLKYPSCIRTQPILNEVDVFLPIFDVHINLCLCDQIFEVWLLPAICL